MPTLIEMFGRGYQLGETQANERKARKAAIEQYGPMARDPALFNQIQQNLNMRANRERAGQQQRFDQRNQQFEMTQAKQGQKRQAVLGVVNALRAARDRGEPLDAAFDRVAGTLPRLGVDPGDLPDMKKQLLENPAVLDDYHAALTGKGTTVAPSTSTAEPDLEMTREEETGLQKMDEILRTIGELEDPKRQREAQSVFGPPGLSKLLFQGGFGGAGQLPWTPAADYANDLAKLTEGELRAAAFETLKGGGHITEKESEFARDAMARLSRTTTFEEYRKELGDLKNYIAALKAAGQRRIRGEDVPSLVKDGDPFVPTPYPEPNETAPSAPPPGGDDGSGGGPPDWLDVKKGEFVEGLGTFQGGDPTDLSNWKL